MKFQNVRANCNLLESCPFERNVPTFAGEVFSRWGRRLGFVAFFVGFTTVCIRRMAGNPRNNIGWRKNTRDRRCLGAADGEQAVFAFYAFARFAPMVLSRPSILSSLPARFSGLPPPVGALLAKLPKRRNWPAARLGRETQAPASKLEWSLPIGLSRVCSAARMSSSTKETPREQAQQRQSRKGSA
jgi:hypothetical protein